MELFMKAHGNSSTSKKLNMDLEDLPSLLLIIPRLNITKVIGSKIKCKAMGLITILMAQPIKESGAITNITEKRYLNSQMVRNMKEIGRTI